MDNPNNNQILPPQPLQSLPEPKKWDKHKGTIAIAVLAIIAGVTIWIYFTLNQPQDLGPIVINHTSKQRAESQSANNQVSATGQANQLGNFQTSNQTPMISIGNTKKPILYPAFSWTEATTAPFQSTSSPPKAALYVIATSKAQGQQDGPALVEGRDWQAVVADDSSNPLDNFQAYYSALYESYQESNQSGLGYNPGNPGFEVAGYDFSPMAGDGPWGSDWGYLFKTGAWEESYPSEFTKDTVQYLALSYGSSDASGNGCRKNCHHITFNVFWSKPVSIGKILDTASWNK